VPSGEQPVDDVEEHQEQYCLDGPQDDAEGETQENIQQPPGQNEGDDRDDGHYDPAQYHVRWIGGSP
jgi:hypothetical protein